MLQFQTYFMWTTIGALALLAVEALAGRHKAIYRWRDVPIICGSLALPRLFGQAPTYLVAVLYGLLLPRWKDALSGAPLWIAFPAVLAAAEFCFYWVHRWAHTTATARVPVLWKLHRTHHSAPYMNTTLYFGRVNPFWTFVVPTSWVMGLAIHLGLARAAGAALVTIMAWNVVTHSNFRWDDAIRRHPRFGPAFRALEHVVVSPGIHHTHHGYGHDGANYRNFAIVLSLFDWMFGTLHIPQGRPSRYGLPGPNAHWLEELFYPVVRIRPGKVGQKKTQTVSEARR